jgi:hypothetical protein
MRKAARFQNGKITVFFGKMETKSFIMHLNLKHFVKYAMKTITSRSYRVWYGGNQVPTDENAFDDRCHYP